MVAMTNTTSLTLLKDEIDVSLTEAEKHLEAWAGNPEQGSGSLDACVETLRQLRGIFRLLDFPAALMLADDMAGVAALAREASDPARYVDALSQGILLLGRYLEYVQLRSRSQPEVLVAGINDLRRTAGKPLIQESHFFAVDLSRDRYPPVPPPEPGIDVARLCRRLRHMYQVGLLGVLRGQNSTANLKLMARALARVDRLCGPAPMTRVWWVARGVLEAMIVDDMVLTSARKALLAQYDRQLKRLIYDGARALQSSDLPLLLIKESIYIVSLCSRSPGVIGEIKQVYDLRGGLTDAALQEEVALMAGGSGSVVRSVAQNIKHDLEDIQRTLDMAAEGVADIDYGEIADTLQRIASTMVMIKLDAQAAQIRARATAIRAWRGDQMGPDSAGFHELVDDLLLVDNAVAELERSLAPADDMRKAATNNRISLYKLDEARAAVVAESRSGLATVKRAVTGFMENNWDRMHLANLPGVLAGVAGGLTFLELTRARAIVDACRAYIEQALLAAGMAPPTREQMETLADAISSVDYYLESMEEQKPIGDSVLEVAEDSLDELGYPVVSPAES